MILLPREVEVRHFHLFCGLGGGARGFNHGRARVGNAEAVFRCLGGVDVDASAVSDFERLAGAPGTALDLFDREQYTAFHGTPPPDGWREASPVDLQRAAGWERPHILFTSPPCKGFSGLLSQTRSETPKYQALNQLTLRGLMLALEAWAEDPPEFVLLENVPRIATRGRRLLDGIVALLGSHGYAVAETAHDCGELGGLAQTRRRFLLVARHREKVPPFLYEPPRRPLRGVGEVLERLPLPGDATAGPMHRMRELQWRTWVRLAFVEAGGDWRSLERLRVEGGHLADYAILPETSWHQRPAMSGQYGQYGVRRWYRHQFRVAPWDARAGSIIGATRPGSGAGSVADPRLGCDASDREARRFNNIYRVVRWDQVSRAVTGGGGPSAGGVSVADPRPGSEWRGKGKYRVTSFQEASGAVIAASATGSGAFAVADPRPAAAPRSGVYGVVPWDASSPAVTGSARQDNGAHSVADPRLPIATEQLVALIIAEDGTWHRPFTTLELAALQGLVDPDEHLELVGSSDSGWRERIGNAVPSPAAAAIASVIGQTLLLAWAGETFALGATPIWVRPVAVALAVSPAEIVE